MKRCFLLCTLMIGLFVQGQEGSLDSTFAFKGWRQVSYYSYNNSSQNGVRTFMQGDGKLLVVFSESGGARLARYKSDGVLDKTFADAGFSVRLDNMSAIDAVQQSDGKIVVLGSWWNGTYVDLAVARFNVDGSPDYTFGTNGMTIIDFLGGDDYPTCIAVQGDDKIIVGAEAAAPDLDAHFGVARLNADGTLDTSFDVDGKTVTDLVPGVDYNADYPRAIAVNGEKIYVGGYVYNNGITLKEEVALVSYNGDGSLNTDFGSGGIAITEMDNDVEVSGLAVDDYGRIVVAAFSTSSGEYDSDFILMRYTMSGLLDTDFGGTGIVRTTIGDHAKATAITIRDGKILLAGNTMNNQDGWHFAVARYNSNGTADTEFDSDGVVITNLGFGDEDAVASVTLLPDNKFLLTGETYTGEATNFAVVQYNGDGSLDVNLNETGILTGFYPHPADLAVNAIGVQSDGKILVAGNSKNKDTFYPDVAITRYDVNGIIDTAFGINGVTTIPLNTHVHEVSSLVVQSDGKIILSAWTEAWDFTLARLKPNGTLDSTFGVNGTVNTDFQGSDQIYKVAVQPDGKIIAAGYAHNDDFTVVRYTAAGTLDNTFGTGGKVTTDFFGDIDNATAVVIQSDGKIIVAGYAYNNATSSNEFALARYTTSGKLDTRFGNGGKVTINFGGDDECTSMLLQPDGKIVVAGWTQDGGGNADFALARLNTNGTLDLTFGTSGKVTTDAGARDWLDDITLQSDGKIIVGGTREHSIDVYSAAYVRYKANGTVDSSFATNGKLVSTFPTECFAVAWNNGRLYTAESTFDYPLQGFISAYKAYGLPMVKINDVQVLSPQANAVLTITATGTVSSPITLSYATQDGTAVSKGKNADYKSTKGTVVLTSTTPATTVSIPINASAYTAGSSLKTFNVNLTLSRQMNGVAQLADATGAVTIIPQSTLAESENIRVGHETLPSALSAKAFPNPTATYFTLQLKSGSATAITVRVMDVSGRLIERFNVTANSNISLGSRYLPGIYYAQVQQGSEKLVLRLVKQ